MIFLDGIKKFLTFINDNWTSILVIIGLIVALIKKIKDYAKKSTEEKIEIAKTHVREAILKMITDAEIDFEDWNKAGSIKRSQVIKQIFDEYPILSKAADQDALISWIDEEINNALKTLRDVISQKDSVEEEA